MGGRIDLIHNDAWKGGIMEKVVRTCCQSSHSECGVLVHVKDGKVTKIEGDPNHPFTRGYVCVKAQAQPQLIYHPDRVTYPMKRAGERGGGKWKRVSWEEALDDIAAKLTKVKEAYAPESFASTHGTGPRPSSLATTVLAHALGSPNVISTDLHICYAPSVIMGTCTFGSPVMMEQGPDYLSADCIMIWGGNPVNSHGPRGRDALEAKKRGAKLIVVDPRRIQLAQKADLWLQIRPATDAALALGMMRLIIEEGLYDKDFVTKWCHGFEQLKERVQPYTLEKVEEITWIPAQQIKEAARLYATTKPAVLHHRVALEHNINSSQTLRALNILIGLTGNIDVKGGNLISQPVEGYIRGHAIYAGQDPRFRVDPKVEAKRIGIKEYPLIAGGGPVKAFTFVHAGLATEAMLNGKPYPIKALYCAGGNPLVNQQNVKKLREALLKLDLHVVAEFFMTPTAELADYVLPVTNWLERDETCDGMYMDTIAARQKVVEPPGECWDDLKIAIELVKRIPWADQRFIPWKDTDELNEFRVKGVGLSFEEFKKKGYVTVPHRYKKYEDSGFKTPTGKVELYSTIFEQLGYDPLPHFVEPPESPVSTPELLKDYPLILITGGRYINFFHSEGRQIPRLRKMVPDPLIQIHPSTAKEHGIKAGDWVWVETPQVKGERVKLRAKLTTDVDSRVVNADHSWWFPEQPAPDHGCYDSNVAVIVTYDPPRDPVVGSVRTRGTLCRIYPV
jgi:anaerobic selenocysteine-containing dehydrogenase